MSSSEFVTLARQQARLYSLNESLVCAVCEHESSWDPWASRPEPAFEKRYEEIIKTLTPQERWLRSISYGLMQVMGQTAYELGFTGKFPTKLCDPLTGLTYGCLDLKRCILKSPDEKTALLHYNGGSDPTYPNIVLALKPKYVVIAQQTAI